MPERTSEVTGGAPVRLHTAFGSAAVLLRELSRALNEGGTLVRTGSGFPSGTRVVLVLSAVGLSAPVVLDGVVTGRRRRGAGIVMRVRYDLDARHQRRKLAGAMAELRRQTRRRREARVPLALPAEADALLRGLRARLNDASRGGARLELFGPRLPAVAVGDRVVMRLAGSLPGRRRPAAIALRVMWVGPVHAVGRVRRQEVGGLFVGLSPGLRNRIGAILHFDDVRPALRLERVEKARFRLDPIKQAE